MDRSIPVCNKLLSKKWDRLNSKIHYDRMRHMRSTIDSACPSSLKSSNGPSKRDQLKEGERYSDLRQRIYKENKILVDKITEIKAKHQPKPKAALIRRSKGSGARDFRAMQIKTENKALVERLSSRQSMYSARHWEEDRREKEKLLRVICEFPYQFSVSRRQRLTRDLGKRRHKSELQKGEGKLPRKLAPLATNLRFRKTIEVGGRQFLVEIYRSEDRLSVHASDMHSTQTFTLDLTSEEAKAMPDSSEEYEALIARLDVKSEELVLLDEEYADDDFEESPL